MLYYLYICHSKCFQNYLKLYGVYELEFNEIFYIYFFFKKTIISPQINKLESAGPLDEIRLHIKNQTVILQLFKSNFNNV